MSKQLFPVEIIDNSAEKLISGHSKRSFVIYNIAICAIVLVVTLSFVVTVEVNTTSRGMIKTPGERVALNSPYSGFITQMSVKENQVVYKGELLMVLNTDKHSSELNKLQRRIGELNQFIADLNRLIRVERDGTLSDVSLQTGLYKQSMNYFVSQMVDLNTRVQNVESNYKRSCRLHEFGDISTADFEPIEAEYVNAQNAVELFFDRQVSSWQSELDSYIVQRRELAAQSAQLNSQKNEAEVRSPVDGIIQRVEGINSGTYLQQGQKLVEISVDSALYVECLVEPRDIGYLQVGQSVRLQVDAFNGSTGFRVGKV